MMGKFQGFKNISFVFKVILYSEVQMLTQTSEFGTTKWISYLCVYIILLSINLNLAWVSEKKVGHISVFNWLKIVAR